MSQQAAATATAYGPDILFKTPFIFLHIFTVFPLTPQQIYLSSKQPFPAKTPHGCRCCPLHLASDHCQDQSRRHQTSKERQQLCLLKTAEEWHGELGHVLIYKGLLISINQLVYLDFIYLVMMQYAVTTVALFFFSGFLTRLLVKCPSKIFQLNVRVHKIWPVDFKYFSQ